MTFGCLNNICKVNTDTLKLWAKVMRATPDSRLILLAAEGSHRARISGDLAAEGAARECVEFVTPRPMAEYLKLYQHIDIGLDTLPYNGHTTSVDAFWMGVPVVVTLVGNTTVGRAGLSLAMNLGLEELVAWTAGEFVEKAAGLARNGPRLRDYRTSLRERMRKSPLMDARGYAREIEACYRQMWRTWSAGSRGSRLMESSPISQVLRVAIARHQAGDLAQAQRLYRQVLEQNPVQPDALHLLGTLMGQSGHPESAVELLERAVALRPAAGYQLNLGLTLQTLGRRAAAIAAFREMVRQRPQMAEAHASLGSALLQDTQTAEAIACLREAVRLNPALAAAQLDLGNALKAAGDWPGAICAYQESTRIEPALAEGHFNLGNAFQAAGRVQDAVPAYLEAARLKPADAGTWNNLAGAYLALGRIAPAVDAFEKAIACRATIMPRPIRTLRWL